MMKLLKNILITWNATHSERAKLQYAYVVLAIAGIFIAGLVGLINDAVSQLIVNASLILLGVFVVNMLAWAILYGLLISKIPAPEGPKTPKPKRRKP